MKDRLTSLLRLGERYANLDLVYFASGSFWQTFGQVGSSLLALGLVLVFANYLPKEVYGTYRYLISLAGLLNVLTLTGMSQAVSQAVATEHDGAFRSAVRYQVKWNSLLTLACLVLGGYYLSHGNVVYAGGLLVLGICVPLTNALNTYGAYLGAKREFRLNNIFGVLATLIYVLGMVAAIFWGGTAIWLVIAYAVTALSSNALFYVITLWRFRPPLESSPDTIRYGWRLTAINLMNPIVSQADSIVLNHFWGAAPLAVYSIAMAIPNRAVPLFKSWIDLGFPKMAAKTREEINQTFYQRIAQGMAFGLVATLGYIVIAPYFFKYLMPQYLDAVSYTQLLALTFLFSMPNRYLSTLFSSQRMTKLIFVSGFCVNIIRIVLYVVLGIWGGILGLIIAQIATDGIGLVVNIATWQLAGD